MNVVIQAGALMLLSTFFSSVFCLEARDLSISIPPQSSTSKTLFHNPDNNHNHNDNDRDLRVARTGGFFDTDALSNFTSLLEDQSENVSPSDGSNTHLLFPQWREDEPLSVGVTRSGTSGIQITDSTQTAVAGVSMEMYQEFRCLEVISECLDNVYYVAFADGGPQVYKGSDEEIVGYFYWDALGWYRLDASQPRAQYCTVASQVALYVDVSNDRIQSPRSEVFWSLESNEDTGKWCVHPTQLFHYRFYWKPTSTPGEYEGFFEDQDSGWRFDSCSQASGVIREFYEYPVTGIQSYNQLRILRC